MAAILFFCGRRKEAAEMRGVKVGTGCRIYTRHFGSEPFLITIGDRVTVAEGVRFVTHEGAAWLFRDSGKRLYYYAGISIGDDVFLGVGAVVLPGVAIGDGSVVGAGAVVTKSVPGGQVVGGNPAKILCATSELRRRLEKKGFWGSPGMSYEELTK